MQLGATPAKVPSLAAVVLPSAEVQRMPVFAEMTDEDLMELYYLFQSDLSQKRVSRYDRPRQFDHSVGLASQGETFLSTFTTNLSRNQRPAYN